MLGATGQLGSDITRAARARRVPVEPLGHEQVEIADRTSVADALRRIRPSIVINCAAFHDVDRCEIDPEAALRVNAFGALAVAQEARSHGSRVVFVSTDYVFGDKPFGEGARGTYTEDDIPFPRNVYGATKLAGEHFVAIAQPDSLIVRVAGLFGRTGSRVKGGTNFVEKIISHARAGEPVEVVNDQFVTPTYTVDASEAILSLATAGVRGLVHVANGGACTWYTFAATVLRLLGVDVEVVPVPSSRYRSKAARPANSALNTDRLTSLSGGPLRPWPDALRAYLAEKGHLPPQG